MSVLLASFLFLQLPVLFYNLTTFGSLTSTGYGFWFPNLYGDWRNIFSFDYAFGSGAHALSYLRALIGLPERSTFGAPIPLYPPLVALMALVRISASGVCHPSRHRLTSTARSARDGANRYLPLDARFAWLAVGLILVTFLIYSFYYFDVDLRFVHLFLPLAAVLSSGGVSKLFAPVLRSVQDKPRRVRRAVTAVGMGILAAAFIGGWQLIEPINKSTIWRGELFSDRVVVAPSAVFMQMVRDYTEQNAWVVSDAIEPAYFSAYEGYDSRRRILALDKKACCYNKMFSIPSLKSSPDLFEKALRQGQPIYFIGAPKEFAALPGASSRFRIQPVQSRVGWEDGPSLILYRIVSESNATSSGK